jgi:hypothetical protein
MEIITSTKVMPGGRGVLEATDLERGKFMGQTG